MKSEIVIYQMPDGSSALDVTLDGETIWLSLNQIATLFGRDKSVISRHLKNIFHSEELDHQSVVAFFATTAADGKQYQVEYFNLDVTLSVGYRVNSKQGTLFRQWASTVLKDHVLRGYTFNRERIRENYSHFLTAVTEVKQLLSPDSQLGHSSILELITLFADTWLSLDAYDKDALNPTGLTQQEAILTAEGLARALQELKTTLIHKQEATDLFGLERTSGSLSGIVGNVLQSFDDQPLYPSLEEKAAHLLYFIVKNHPFVDGNKRSGAYAFIWFLRQANALDTTRITPPALTAITLLIAESNPQDKSKMIGLVCHLLAGK